MLAITRGYRKNDGKTANVYPILVYHRDAPRAQNSRDLQRIATLTIWGERAGGLGYTDIQQQTSTLW